MRIIILGPPGAGKGTQARYISEFLKVPHVSTGDMLRTASQSGSPLGQKVQAIMASGQLVDDALMIELVQERLTRSDCERGFVLDGFPRTLPQAMAFDQEGLSVEVVLYLEVKDEEIVQRMAGRLTHLPSGRIYHQALNPPKVVGKDDVTGEPLICREDDQEGVVRKRLAVYAQQTMPVVDYYRQKSQSEANLYFYSISGSGTASQVFERIVDCIITRHKGD